jgi:hypothetical protein
MSVRAGNAGLRHFGAASSVCMRCGAALKGVALPSPAATAVPAAPAAPAAAALRAGPTAPANKKAKPSKAEASPPRPPQKTQRTLMDAWKAPAASPPRAPAPAAATGSPSAAKKEEERHDHFGAALCADCAEQGPAVRAARVADRADCATNACTTPQELAKALADMAALERRGHLLVRALRTERPLIPAAAPPRAQDATCTACQGESGEFLCANIGGCKGGMPRCAQLRRRRRLPRVLGPRQGGRRARARAAEAGAASMVTPEQRNPQESSVLC